MRQQFLCPRDGRERSEKKGRQGKWLSQVSWVVVLIVIYTTYLVFPDWTTRRNRCVRSISSVPSCYQQYMFSGIINCERACSVDIIHSIHSKHYHDTLQGSRKPRRRNKYPLKLDTDYLIGDWVHYRWYHLSSLFQESDNFKAWANVL